MFLIKAKSIQTTNPDFFQHTDYQKSIPKPLILVTYNLDNVKKKIPHFHRVQSLQNIKTGVLYIVLCWAVLLLLLRNYDEPQQPVDSAGRYAAGNYKL